MTNNNTILPLDQNKLSLITQLLNQDITKLTTGNSPLNFLNKDNKQDLVKNIKDNVACLETGIKDLQILIKMLIDHEEDAVTDLENKSHNYFEHSLTCDLDGRILTMNDLAKAFFEYDNNSLIGKNIATLNNKFKLDIELNQHIEKKLDFITNETDIKSKDNQWLKIKSHWILHRDNQALPSHYSFVFIIINEQNINSADIEKEKQLIKISYRSALHDFRTILTQVSAGLTIISNTELNKVNEDLCELLRKSLIRGDKIINSIQEENFQNIQKEIVSIDTLVEEAQLTFYNTDPNINFILHKNTNLLEIEVAENQIFLIICSIYKNAIQAMQNSGNITTSIDLNHVVTKQSVQNYLQICISDEGPGIPKKHLDYIFDPDFSSKFSSSAQGIGLAHSQFVLHNHGGYIEIDSNENGSVFRINLPI